MKVLGDICTSHVVVNYLTSTPIIYDTTIILGLNNHQVDYTQAFPQAELTDPIYIHIKQGWFTSPCCYFATHSNPRYKNTTHYIQLKRSLCGCKQAAWNWFQFLDQGLKAKGYHESSIDPSLWCTSPSNTIIDDHICNVSKTSSLADQGNISDYLAIDIKYYQSSKTITMTQTGTLVCNLHIISAG
jgi:hypothetical protein